MSDSIEITVDVPEDLLGKATGAMMFRDGQESPTEDVIEEVLKYYVINHHVSERDDDDDDTILPGLQTRPDTVPDFDIDGERPRFGPDLGPSVDDGVGGVDL